MAMPKRKPGQNALADLRADVVKHSKDITALKARIVDAESRLAKAETALGTVAKSGAPPNVEREEAGHGGDVTLSDDAHGEDDASQPGADE